MAYKDLVARFGTHQSADLHLVQMATNWAKPGHLVYFPEDNSFWEFSAENFEWQIIGDAYFRCTEAVRPTLSNFEIMASSATLTRIFDHVKQHYRTASFTDKSLIFDNGVLNWSRVFPCFTPRRLYESDPYTYLPPRSLSRIRCNFLDEPLPTPNYERIRDIYPAVVEAIERHAHNALFNRTHDEQFLLIIGTRCTGKTTLFQIFANALSSIAAHATLQSFSEDGHGRIKCYRKRLILKNDHPENPLDSAAFEFFKNMVEPGVLQLRQLYCPAFDWHHTGFGGILTTNKPPYVPDYTDWASWFRRWEIVEMNIPMPMDPAFKSNVLAEIDSIISRVVQSEPDPYWISHDMDEQIKDRQKIYQYWRQPVRFALDAVIEPDLNPEERISINLIDDAVVDYLLSHNFTVPKSKTLHEQISEYFAEKRVIKRLVNDFNGNRCNHFYGIRFTNEANQKKIANEKMLQELAEEDARERRMIEEGRSTGMHLTWDSIRQAHLEDDWE